jgi:streptogrisin C
LVKLGSVGAVALVALSTVLAGQPAGAETETAVASGGVVAAMQRDLGLTEDQARARLRQESVAIKVDLAARRAAGAAYGGSWSD